MIEYCLQKVNNRNSTLELLRILAMFMVVFHHFSVHGCFQYDHSVVSVPRFWVNFISSGGKIGVDLFVLTTGYFLIDNQSGLKLKRIFRLLLQVGFYLFVIWLFAFSWNHSFLANKYLMHTRISNWWFFNAYLMLYLLHPFINVMLKSLTKITYQRALLFLGVIWSLLRTFGIYIFQCDSLAWFVFLYSIAAYIKMYGLNSKLTVKDYNKLLLGALLVTYLLSFTLLLLGTQWERLSRSATRPYSDNSIFVLFISIFLFMSFLKRDIVHSKWINIVSSATFGVYLIHDSSIIRHFLWEYVFHNATYQNDFFIIPYSIGVVFLVYLVCTLIDLTRLYYFEKPIIILLDRKLDQADEVICKIADKFREKLF